MEIVICLLEKKKWCWPSSYKASALSKLLKAVKLKKQNGNNKGIYLFSLLLYSILRNLKQSLDWLKECLKLQHTSWVWWPSLTKHPMQWITLIWSKRTLCYSVVWVKYNQISLGYICTVTSFEITQTIFVSKASENPVIKTWHFKPNDFTQIIGYDIFLFPDAFFSIIFQNMILGFRMS